MVAAMAGLLYFFVDIIGYQVVALILLLGVSILAMLFDIFPVMVAAMLSALIWNFLFIPPTFTFHVGTPEDALMFLMYFVVALINAVLTFKIREVEKEAREKEEREKTIALYNTLLNSLSHELRTPISTIIGAVDTIKENAQRLSEEQKDELYTEIKTAGFRLNRQVENLLNMSRLEAGALKPKPDWCDVNEMVHSIIQNFSDKVQRHSIVFNADEKLPLFRLDRGLVEQILHNIIHNALQHTPDDSVISILVNHVNNTFCRFTISDNGPGFPETELDSVFEKFHRLPQAKAGGTGLGLSIAKGLTEALNGTIRLENIANGGAQFTIDIPAESSSLNGITHD